MAGTIPGPFGAIKPDHAIRCMLCCSPVKQPQLLQCKHTFCRKCWMEFRALSFRAQVGSGQGQAPKEDDLTDLFCPVCAEIITTDDVKTALPNSHPSYFISNYLMLEPANDYHGNQRLCQLCYQSAVGKKRNISEKFCVDCFREVCLTCAGMHFEKNHTLWDLHQDFLLRCKKHGDIVTKVCNTCKQTLICDKCLVASHVPTQRNNKYHDIQTLRDFFLYREGRLAENMQELRQEISNRHLVCKKLEAIRVQQNLQLCRTTADIDKQAELMIEEINKQKVKLKEVLLRRHSQVVEALKDQRTFVEYNIHSMEKLSALMSLVSKDGQEFALLANYDDLRLRSFNMCHRKAAALDPKSLEAVQTSLVLKPKVDLSLGELKLEMMSSPKTEMDHVPIPPVVQLQGKPKLLWKHGLSKSEMSSSAQPHGLAFLPNGRLVVAYHSARHLRIFGPKGQDYGTVRFARDLVCPKDIIHGGENSLLVTDSQNKKIQAIKAIPDKVVVRDIKQHVIDGFPKQNILREPAGIAADFHLGQIVVTDTGTDSVVRLTTGGKVVDTFGCHGDGEKEFKSPEFVAIDKVHRILVSDCNNHCIKVFDSEGNFLKKFGSYGHNVGQLSHPGGIAVDHHGYILVADGANNRVCMYSPDGSTCKVLLTLMEHGVLWPYGLAVGCHGNSSYIALTQRADNTVAVFSYDMDVIQNGI